jgi:hypothetical protein
VLTENTVFKGVGLAINVTDFDNAESVAYSYGNLYIGGTPSAANLGSNVFVPPYPYTVEPVGEVEAKVQESAGNL